MKQNLMKVWPKLDQTDKDNLELWARVGLQRKVDQRNLPLLDTDAVYEILEFLDWAHTVKPQAYITKYSWSQHMRKLMDDTYEM